MTTLTHRSPRPGGTVIGTECKRSRPICQGFGNLPLGAACWPSATGGDPVLAIGDVVGQRAFVGDVPRPVAVLAAPEGSGAPIPSGGGARDEVAHQFIELLEDLAALGLPPVVLPARAPWSRR